MLIVHVIKSINNDVKVFYLNFSLYLYFKSVLLLLIPIAVFAKLKESVIFIW